MKTFLMKVTARVGQFIKLRRQLSPLWPETSAVRCAHLLAVGLIGAFILTLACFGPRLMHRIPPLLVQLRAALPTTQAPEALCAPFGEHRSVRLEDNTSVTLNSGTCIVAELSKRVRFIHLESGEAIFRVARDPRRPFVVETGPLAIQVLGTEFDVYRTAATTLVSVIEGSVQVSSRSQTSTINTKPLTVLEQMDIPDNPLQSRVRRTITASDYTRLTAWVHGDIQLQEQTLKQVFTEAKRYQHIQVDFQDPAIADIRFSGLLHTNELDGLLLLLKFKCIHSDYVPAQQRITLTYEPGKHAGMTCR